MEEEGRYVRHRTGAIMPSSLSSLLPSPLLSLSPSPSSMFFSFAPRSATFHQVRLPFKLVLVGAQVYACESEARGVVSQGRTHRLIRRGEMNGTCGFNQAGSLVRRANRVTLPSSRGVGSTSSLPGMNEGHVTAASGAGAD